MSRTTFKITSKLLLSSPNNYKSCKYVSCIALFFLKCNLITWNGFKPMSNLNVKSCEFLHVAYTWIRQMSAWKSIGWIHKHLTNTNTSTSHDQEGSNGHISLLMIVILLQWLLSSSLSFIILLFYHYGCLDFCCSYLFMFARPHPLICYCGCLDICCSYFAIKNHLYCPPFYCCGCLGLHYSYYHNHCDEQLGLITSMDTCKLQ